MIEKPNQATDGKAGIELTRRKVLSGAATAGVLAGSPTIAQAQDGLEAKMTERFSKAIEIANAAYREHFDAPEEPSSSASLTHDLETKIADTILPAGEDGERFAGERKLNELRGSWEALRTDIKNYMPKAVEDTEKIIAKANEMAKPIHTEYSTPFRHAVKKYLTDRDEEAGLHRTMKNAKHVINPKQQVAMPDSVVSFESVKKVALAFARYNESIVAWVKSQEDLLARVNSGLERLKSQNK